jgi:hypothetical protein
MTSRTLRLSPGRLKRDELPRTAGSDVAQCRSDRLVTKGYFRVVNFSSVSANLGAYLSPLLRWPALNTFWSEQAQRFAD